MLVLKDVLSVIKDLVLQGGRVPIRQVPYRQQQCQILLIVTQEMAKNFFNFS